MESERTISTVAVGTDGSTTAGQAVAEAAEIARRFEAKLVLLSAFGDAGAPTAAVEDIELQWATKSSAVVSSLLDQLEERFRQDGLECETRAEHGDPADVLVRLASECGADLLVIGNKGAKRRVLGSVPHAVTRKAECSVLVVKTT